MTSQRWLTDSEFSATSESGSIWWHYLVVIVPENVKYTRNGTLWITGYGMGTIPDEHNEDVIYTAALATNVGIITGILFQVRRCLDSSRCPDWRIISYGTEFLSLLTLLTLLTCHRHSTDPQRAHDLLVRPHPEVPHRGRHHRVHLGPLPEGPVQPRVAAALPDGQGVSARHGHHHGVREDQAS
jgi:hypothetical protein